MLEPGRRLGSFEVLSMVGSGGTGEVYLARDCRLAREVALKVLPPALGIDPGRLARFESEPRILASLSHPAIGAIYGLEEAEGVLFLVLEFVAGETLREKLKRGPLPVKEALHLCAQVAEALEAAHRKGVIHRDLKPANVKVTPAGNVKVLDFGIAQAFLTFTDDDGGSDPEMPTHPQATTDGTIVGTAAYMSPEQALGQPVDSRTDLWSFGCILYEMLTGRSPFAKDTVPDTIAAVLGSEPDWTLLPRATPEGIRTLLRRCLQRDRNWRLHHIADARIEIEEALSGPRPRSRGLSAALAGGMALAVIWTLVTRQGTPAPVVRARPRLGIHLPPLQLSDFRSGQTTLALSADGARLVFAAGPSGGRRLYVRALAELEAQPIPGTEGGDNPFLSPDGQWVGFDVEGKLKKVRIQGGEPVTLCDVPSLRGASWGADGTIVLAPSSWSGLWRIPAGGGALQRLTTPIAGQELSHRWPQILPGGKAVLFSVMTASGREDERSIAVVSLETGQRQNLLQAGTCPKYAATGHLLYVRAGSLHAAPFDRERFQLRGPAVPVLEDVLEWPKTSGAAYFDVSQDGTLVYVPGYPYRRGRSLLWIDRQGRASPLAVPSRLYAEPALSPDGRRLALTVEGPSDDIWVYEMDRDTWTRLTFAGDNGAPAWSPDGRQVAFTSTRNGARNLFRAPADGSAPPEQLTHSANWQNIASYAPDGRALLFTEQDAATLSDIWMLTLGGDGKPTPLVVSPAIELFPTLSPDGRWLAYTSTESRREEVYLRSFPGPGRKWPVSRQGGSQPLWSASGRELFYRSGNTLMSVSVRTGPDLTLGVPQPLFTAPGDVGGVMTNYAVTGDGRRFLVVKGADREISPQIVVVSDWFPELRARAED